MEKANSTGRRPTVQGEGQQYREKANSTGRSPPLQRDGQQQYREVNNTGIGSVRGINDSQA